MYSEKSVETEHGGWPAIRSLIKLETKEHRHPRYGRASTELRKNQRRCKKVIKISMKTKNDNALEV